MKKTLLALAMTAAFAGTLAHAQDAKPAHEVSFNAAVVSDYRYRGISQTRLDPALQGGADYVHNPSGFYVGTWLSTIKWIRDLDGDSRVEMDIYGGKRGELGGGLTYDVGVLRYQYPNNKLAVSANTTELYGQLGYGPAYVKYSHSVTDLFGFTDSENSGYLDVGANLDAGNGFTVNLHAGHQKVKNNSDFDYTDWKIGVTKDFGVVTGALAYIGTNADKTAYASPANGKFMGKDAIVVSVSKTF